MNYYTQVRPELRPFIPAHRRVLEIGCGHGRFSEHLSRDSEIWGVEPNAEAARAAQQRLHKVLTGTFETVRDQLPERAFDLVVCNDVIEHMANDRAFLLDIQRTMAPGAHLMGSIPNMRYWRVLKALLFSKEWHYEEDGGLDRTHLRFYTIRSFPRLLREVGFEVVRFEGINNMLSPRKRFILGLFGKLFSDVSFLQFAFLVRLPAAAPSADEISR